MSKAAAQTKRQRLLEIMLGRHAYTMHTPCTHHAHTMHTPCIHHAYTMHTPCTHHAHTMHTPCIHHACACSMHTIVLGRDGQLPGFLLAPPRTAGRLRLELVELAMPRRLSEAMLRQLQQQPEAAAVEGEKKGAPLSQAKTAGVKRAEEKLEKQARYLVITRSTDPNVPSAPTLPGPALVP